MLKMRLQRIGRKHEPVFRIVVVESTRGPKSGNYIERVGYYHAKLGKREINRERAAHWLSRGAQVSDTVFNFLVDEKVVPGPKRNKVPRQKPSPHAQMSTQEGEGVGEGGASSADAGGGAVDTGVSEEEAGGKVGEEAGYRDTRDAAREGGGQKAP